MTDHELLEKAAKAAGIELVWHQQGDPDLGGEAWCFIPTAKAPHNRREGDKRQGVIWNPLDDDGDALRLAVKLRIDICFGSDFLYTQTTTAPTPMFTESNGDDPYAATRRAIVRAAAVIGETP